MSAIKLQSTVAFYWEMLSFPAQNWQKLPKPSRVRVASLIIPRLYLSDYSTACDNDVLQRLGITHVVSVIELDPEIPNCIPDHNKLHLSLPDRMDADVLGHLEHTTEFIHSALSENDTNKILVHCFQGISRSATVVCAYLIAKHDKGASQSISFVQKQRDIVCPNIGFRQQLELYAARYAHNRVKEAEMPALARIAGSIFGRFRQQKVIAVAPPVAEVHKSNIVNPS